MEKGNKVEIVNTNDMWEGKHGTVLSQEDNEVTVRVNFETDEGTQSVIEIFDEENLEMERENESLNEELTLDKGHYDLLPGFVCELLDKLIKEYGEKPWFKDFWKEYKEHVIVTDMHRIKMPNYFLKKYIEKDESLNESLNYEKVEDFIHPYVYLKDFDDEEIPSWNFVLKIAAAENVEEGVILKCAEDNKYKLFAVEAPEFFKMIVAAKEVKLEDIQEQYADFLQGNAIIYEMK